MTDWSDPKIIRRVMAKVDRRGSDECWPWTGAQVAGGYGVFSVSAGSQTMAHRAAYQILVGPIPDGLQLDHLCRNRICVNPAHLEPVTCRENLLRGETVNAAAKARTHCVNGHPFDHPNTLIEANGRRVCRTCKRLRQRRYRAARRA